MWEIVNPNNYRWGRETYANRAEAEKELKQFWKGVSGVDLKKFTIREVASPPQHTATRPIHRSTE